LLESIYVRVVLKTMFPHGLLTWTCALSTLTAISAVCKIDGFLDASARE